MSAQKMAAAADGLSARLAQFVVASRWQDVPEAVRAHGVRAIFNGVGTALGGSSDPSLIVLAKALAPFSGAATATVIGSRTRSDPPTAAFLNAAAINVFDFDDTHQGTIIHPTAPVAPALFALAEMQPVSGREMVHAFVLGVEVACRLGNAVSPGHYDRGWHITATCGVFGAAAAAGKLLGLSDAQMVAALGIASAQASGLVETLGYGAKSVGVGNAARNGLLSALMAREGLGGPPAPIEGPRGFLAVTCDETKPAAVESGLGTQWEVLRNMFKPYPCGVVLNPVIDACLTAHAQAGFSTDRIAEIRVKGNPLLKARTDRPDAATGREAQVSAQHAVAVSLLRGSAGAEDFSDRAVTDPTVCALRRKVVAVEADPSYPIEAASVLVTYADGERVEFREDTATGSLERPMSDAALRAKFAALASFGCPELDAAPLADAVWTLAEAGDTAAVLALARPAQARSR